MTRFFESGALGLLWVLVTGTWTLGNLIAGWLIGLLVLTITAVVPDTQNAIRHPLKALKLVLFFLWELLVSNLNLARVVITPRLRIEPGVVGVPLDAATDTEITLLANLITLTPGTLTVDVSDDRRTLYVHGIDVRDREAFIRSIKDGFERRVLEVLR